MTKEEAIARIKDHIVVHRYLERNAVKLLEALDMAIKALEQPERKKGRWERHYCEDGNPDGWACSKCGEWFYFGDKKPNFCPDCGADMRRLDHDSC